MSEAVNYIALAIPVFFLLIGVELLVGKLKRTQYYRFNDAITNLSCGITQQVGAVFLKTFLLLGYIFLYENYRLFDFPGDQWWTWVVLFIGVDFFYYWFHRYAHEISLMWGGHIVHHQSEEYNLSVALRQGAFQAFFSWIFYLPLGLIGFDPLAFVLVNQFQTLYQFWIHTKAIDRLHPAFEYVFNTPSHHRVHHGQNPQYIDKNHGGTLIIWDRMFGTFQAEEEEVVYGVTKGLKSWNPVWANLDYFRDMFRLAVRVRSLGDFVRVFTKPPGWRPDYLAEDGPKREVTARTFRKFDVLLPAGLNRYVLFQYVLVLVGATFFLFSSGKMEEIFGAGEGLFWLVALAVMIVASVSTLGGLLERRRWAVYGEAARLLLASGMLSAMWRDEEWLVWGMLGLGAVALGSFAWLSRFLFAFQAPGKALG